MLFKPWIHQILQLNSNTPIFLCTDFWTQTPTNSMHFSLSNSIVLSWIFFKQNVREETILWLKQHLIKRKWKRTSNGPHKKWWKSLKILCFNQKIIMESSCRWGKLISEVIIEYNHSKLSFLPSFFSWDIFVGKRIFKNIYKLSSYTLSFSCSNQSIWIREANRKYQINARWALD